jgi:hypothetical protein
VPGGKLAVRLSIILFGLLVLGGAWISSTCAPEPESPPAPAATDAFEVPGSRSVRLISLQTEQ